MHHRLVILRRKAPRGSPLCSRNCRRRINVWLSNMCHTLMTQNKGQELHVSDNLLRQPPKVHDVMLKITHDINKNKGHVFNYNVQEIGSLVHSRLGKAPASSLPEPQIATGYESENSVEQNNSSNFKVQGSTVLQTGFLSPVCLYRSFAIEKEGQETSSSVGKKNHG
ncbi:hypothetical protein F2Q69_00019185 [Brassica cretica]|uniref:Uncharacterized protein n=1 Tax=Brassica cretica TaxID=69181 RepID=A0A8S9QAX6_BRACR|nr:hypothetical protein F2Q69_00019185 [Brassica cretica]